MKFSDALSFQEQSVTKCQIPPPISPLEKEDFFRILEKAQNHYRLSIDEAWRCLHLNTHDSNDLFLRLLEVTRRVKLDIFDGEVYPIVPLYVSSYCQEHCIYCNFRAENKNKQVERLRLSAEELAIEVEFLAKKGLRVIELVYATDPFISVEDVCNHIGIVRAILKTFGGGLIGINARPYSVDGYRRLRKSGLDFAVLWQETYDPTRYIDLHPGKTEKTNFVFRLDAAERMLQAGIENIGLGVLSGLSNWRHD